MNMGAPQRRFATYCKSEPLQLEGRSVLFLALWGPGETYVVVFEDVAR